MLFGAPTRNLQRNFLAGDFLLSLRCLDASQGQDEEEVVLIGILQFPT